MPEGGIQRPISTSLVTRLASQAASNVINGVSNAWMGPMQPLAPLAPPDVVGRAFDYSVGSNLNYTPRGTDNHTGASFQDLRFMATSCDLIRLAIETRKDQMEAVEWQIKPRKDIKMAQDDPRILAIQTFFMNPSPEYNWIQWLRALLEDMFVLDAATIWKRRTNGGALFSLDLIDGSTIKPLIDESGRRPIAPAPAFQQVLKGIPAVNYNSDEMIYAKRNVRTNTMYGFSHVEQIIMTGNIAIRRNISQLSYYTDGNLPSTLIGLPENYTVDQVKQFQKMWDAELEGNLGTRRKGKFVPGTLDVKPMIEPQLKDAYDEWLARVVCYTFSLSPQPFVQQMNRATAETADQSAKEEGLEPIKKWLKSILDSVIAQDFGMPQLEFAWQNADEIDPKIASEIDVAYVNAGIRTRNEVRHERGLDAMTDENANKLCITTMSGIIPIDTPQPDPNAGNDDPNNPNRSNSTGLKSGEDKKAPKDAKGDPVKKSLSVTTTMERPLIHHAEAEAQKKALTVLINAGQSVAHQLAHMHILGKADGEDATDAQKKAEEIVFKLDLSTLNDIGDAILSDTTMVAQDAAAISIRQIGNTESSETFGRASKTATAWAKQRSADLVSDIDDATRNMLKVQIAAGIEQGTPMQLLATQIQNSNAFSDARATLIAQTEIGNANSHGALSAYKAAQDDGVNVQKEWVIGVFDACPICVGNQLAGHIPLDEEFPSGDMAPLAHPRCRCALTPFVVED